MRLKLQHLAIGLLAMLPTLLWAQTENEEPQQKPIQLTFQGSGDTETVETVTVENLSRGTSITVNGSEILVLDPIQTGIEDIEAGFGGTEPLLYPNPAEGDGNLVFDVQQEGEVAVRIFSMDGVLMESANVPVFEGRNALSIPSQGYGFFMVSVEGNGIHFSQKWMCGAPNSGNGIRHNGTSAVELPREAIAMTRAQAPESKKIEFEKGDLFRFTATTGNMKTIVMQRPEMDHTITFQMFKCQDADGYNYPIIEVGGMLWMAEDLRPVISPDIAIAKNAAAWTDPYANPLRMAYADYNDGNTETGAYYTPKAAMKALPEGWKLPTADELKVMISALGDSTKAGAQMKAHGEESGWNTPNKSLDEVQLNLTGNGFLSDKGVFTGIGNLAIIATRNFNNGLPICLKLQDGSSEAVLKHDAFGVAGEGYTIRGVRPAQSPYNGFISKWLSKHPENAPKRIEGKDLYAGIQGNPFAYTAPLGQSYEMPSGPDQYITINSIHNITNGNQVDISPINENQLHRYAAQNMPNGLQRTVRLSWSKPSKGDNTIWNEDPVEDECMWGEGTIKIEVFGSSVEKDFKYEGVIDKNFVMPRPKELVNKNDKVTEYGVMVEQYMTMLKAVCADFNGDGIDDILLGMGTKIAIMDGSNYKSTLFEKDYATGKKDCKVVSFSAGDVNKDGQTDLAVLYEVDGNNILEVWWDGLEKFGAASSDDTSITGSKLCSSVIIGDLTENGNMNIICQRFDRTEQQIFIYGYSRENNRLELIKSKDIETDGFIQNSEMALFYPEGIVKPAMLFANGRVFRWSKTAEDLEMLPALESKTFSGGFGVGQLSGNKDGIDNLLITEFKQVDATLCDVNLIEYSYNKRDNRFNKKVENTIHTFTIAKSLFVPPLSSKIGFVKYYFYSTNIIRYVNPIREAKLTSIETTMTEPRIYALLAAAPYWEAYREKYSTEPGTSWGKSNASGGGTSKESSHTASMIAGYEHEFNLPIVATKVGGVDFETRMDWTSTKNQQNTTMTEYGIEYTTIFEDGVVLTLTPFTAYNYTIVRSSNPDELGSTLMIGAPDRPRTMLITLKDYMLLRADNTTIPNLRNLLQHKQGNPWSYKQQYVDELPTTSDILWGKEWPNTGSGGATTQSIAVTQEQESSEENEFALDITLVGTVMGVKAGGGYGYNNKNGIIHKEEVGHTISGSVVAPESIGDEKAKNFEWNICRANVKFGGQKFPVVTYVVRQ